MKTINFDELTISQIKELIKNNICTNEEVVEFYNNEFWDDQH